MANTIKGIIKLILPNPNKEEVYDISAKAANITTTANTIAYYSDDLGTFANYSNIKILDSISSTTSDTRTLSGLINGLWIYGLVYGNTATYLNSTERGEFNYGDPGPLIKFGQTDGTSGALIYTNHDGIVTSKTDTLKGSSFHFVSIETPVHVVTDRFVAKEGITIGNKRSNSNYNLYINGNSYFNGTIDSNLIPNSTNNLGTTTAQWGKLFLSDSLYLYNNSTTNYIRLINSNTSGTVKVIIPNSDHNMYLTHTTSTSAVGSDMLPVYVAENGRLTAITGALTNGSAYLTNYNHYSNSATQTINLDNDEVAVGAMFHFTVKGSVTGSPGVDSTILQMNWANSSGYNSQFGIQTNNNRAFFRRQNAGTWLNWQEIAHGPLNTQVGSSTQPVYLSNTGTITQGTQYAGGTNVTLNGTPKSGNTIEIYTPTTAGNSGLILISSGNGAPQWSNTTSLSDYKYWANIESTSAAKYNTEPEVKSIKITGNTTANTAATNGVVLQYDATLKVLNFVFA